MDDATARHTSATLIEQIWTVGKQQKPGGSHSVRGADDQFTNQQTLRKEVPDAVDTGEARVLLQTQSRVLNGTEETMASIYPSPTFTGIRTFIILSPLPQYLSVKNLGL
jgi:hypothetical protein